LLEVNVDEERQPMKRQDDSSVALPLTFVQSVSLQHKAGILMQILCLAIPSSEAGPGL
jgi:hypothetical protein